MITNDEMLSDQNTSEFFSRLRVRLFILIGLILLPVLILVLYTAREQNLYTTRAVQQEAVRLAQVTALNQSQVIGAARELLVTLAQLSEVTSGDSLRCNLLFSRLRQQQTFYTNVYMVDTNGDTVCTGIPGSEDINVTDAAWFQRAMAQGGFSVSDYAIGLASGRPVVTLSYPVYNDEGAIQYQLGLALDLQRIGASITDANLIPGTSVTVVDRNGRILYRHPDGGPEVMGQVSPWSETLLSKAATQQNGTFEASGHDAEERLYGFSVLDQTNGSAFVVIGLPERLVYSDTNRLLTNQLAALGAVSIAVLLIAWFGTTRFFLHPVQALLDGAQKLRGGRLDSRINLSDVRDTYELHHLGRTMNQMAESLQTTLDTLEQRVEERTADLAFLVRASGIVGTSMDYETSLQLLANVAVPRLADWCTVHVVENGIQRVAIAHSDPSKLEWAIDFERRYPRDPNTSQLFQQILSTGKPIVISHITDEVLVQAAHDEEHLRELRDIGFVSTMILPLTARGAILGVLTLITTSESGRHYNENEDLSVVQELANRAALSIEKARLYAEANEQRERLRVSLNSIGDAVLATDNKGIVTFMNPVAQTLTGWTEEEAIGRDLKEIFVIINEVTGQTAESPVEKVIRERRILGLANHTILITKQGQEIPIDDSAAPIQREDGEMIGVILVFRDITLRRRAEAAEREERRMAEALRDIGTALNSTLDVSEVLDRILETVGTVVPHDSADIMFITDGRAHVVRSKGYPDDEELHEFVIENTASFKQMAATQQPLIIGDIQADPSWVRVAEEEWLHSYIGIPICLNEQVIGFLNLSSRKRNFFTEVHAIRLQAFAEQACTAINNARLYEEAREVAALRERQRLAHDLHDAVSQMLFSSTIISESLLRNQNSSKAATHLETLHRLNRGAHAEMRNLLVQLRPESLPTIDMADLLRQLADAAMGRTEINVNIDVQGTHPLPPSVQSTLYRIAQETLNNTVKHAQATDVTITLSREPEMIRLGLKDNGKGFQMDQVLSGNHMGLNIMRERAEAIGAALEISSEVGEGTEVVVSLVPQAHARKS